MNDTQPIQESNIPRFPQGGEMQSPPPPPSPDGSATRPWQGTFLFVVTLIQLILLAVFILLVIGAVIFGGFFLSRFVENFPGFSFLGAVGGVILILPLVLFILLIFVARGILKGQRWSIIVLLSETILGIISSLSGLSKGFSVLLFLILHAFFLYLEVVCLNHPFYKKKTQ